MTDHNMASWMPDSLVKITQDPRWSKEKKRKRQKRSIQKFKRRHSVKVKTHFLILAVSSSSSRKRNYFKEARNEFASLRHPLIKIFVFNNLPPLKIVAKLLLVRHYHLKKMKMFFILMKFELPMVVLRAWRLKQCSHRTWMLQIEIEVKISAFRFGECES